jgi:EAL domain-containing protein (putative c-di-GMP-specific phosphodiesterase class I)
VAYQPQVDVATGEISGVEALVRWQHPERGTLAPDAFIPTAEATGDIVAIDDWVLEHACAQLAAWDAKGLPRIAMAVNVSARRLVTGDLAATVAAALDHAGIVASRLEIELTETVAVENDALAVEALERLRRLGVQIAIDDFGMGYSALSRLQSFPVDRLKIDRSFVSSLTYGEERGSLVEAMLAIGESLGLRVVAEGVESADHLAALRSLGCQAAQGYLFSRPVPAEELEGLLRAGTLADPGMPAEVTAGGVADNERRIRTLLAELQRVTGLESTYLTRIDWDAAVQQVTHACNAGSLEIGEGLAVDWSDTICRRALEQGVTYTDDVAETFPDDQVGAALGLQTYASVPLRDEDGEIRGTLCGASSQPVALGPEAVLVMEHFAELIIGGVAESAGVDPVPASAA